MGINELHAKLADMAEFGAIERAFDQQRAASNLPNAIEKFGADLFGARAVAAVVQPLLTMYEHIDGQLWLAQVRESRAGVRRRLAREGTRGADEMQRAIAAWERADLELLVQLLDRYLESI